MNIFDIFTTLISQTKRPCSCCQYWQQMVESSKKCNASMLYSRFTSVVL